MTTITVWIYSVFLQACHICIIVAIMKQDYKKNKNKKKTKTYSNAELSTTKNCKTNGVAGKLSIPKVLGKGIIMNTKWPYHTQ